MNRTYRWVIEPNTKFPTTHMLEASYNPLCTHRHAVNCDSCSIPNVIAHAVAFAANFGVMRMEIDGQLLECVK